MPSPRFTVPAGMIEVTKEQFFAYVYASKDDIMPSNRNPDFTVWETRNRITIGRTFPGWKNSGYPIGHPLGEKAYMLVKSALNDIP